jgi:hypothetical protein
VFKRRKSAEAEGDYLLRGLKPIAEHLGLDAWLAIVEAPTSHEAKALDAFRIGQSLLMTFTRPDGWPAIEPREARAAAQRVRRAINADEGRSAVSCMTQGYAREMAAFWRRSAVTTDPAEAEQLLESAARSEKLSELAERFWPVSDPYGALATIARAENDRFVNVDNTDAMIDLRTYFGRARASCCAAAIALGADHERFQTLTYSPVWALDLEFAAGLQADWLFQAKAWANLLTDSPRPYVEILMESQQTAQ